MYGVNTIATTTTTATIDLVQLSDGRPRPDNNRAREGHARYTSPSLSAFHLVAIISLRDLQQRGRPARPNSQLSFATYPSFLSVQPGLGDRQYRRGMARWVRPLMRKAYRRSWRRT